MGTPKYIPYTYMDPLGNRTQLFGGVWGFPKIRVQVPNNWGLGFRV